MGKYLLIKNADFSENAVEQVTPKRYFYHIPDSQMESAPAEWITSVFAYGYSNQDVLSGNVINGMRLKVETAGTLTIFKATKPISGLTDASALTQVATATTTTTGVQDIEFSAPVSLGANECLIIGKSTDTLVGKYHNNNSPSIARFYANVGKSGIVEATGDVSLDIDFFGYLDS